MEKRTTTDRRTPITNLTKLLYLIGREIELSALAWGRARGTTRTRRFVGATDVGTGAGLTSRAVHSVHKVKQNESTRSPDGATTPAAVNIERLKGYRFHKVSHIISLVIYIIYDIWVMMMMMDGWIHDSSPPETFLSTGI